MFTHNGTRYFITDRAVTAAHIGATSTDLVSGVTATAARLADKAGDVAMGYVWGRADGGLSVTSEQEHAFREAYAGHAFEYYMPDTGVGMKTNVRDALTRFLAGRPVNEQTYPRTNADGTVWACCESSIGPVCEHKATN